MALMQQKGLDPNVQDEYGATPLQLVAKREDELFILLLMSSPLLDIRNIDFDAQSKVIQKVLREFETDPLLVSKRYSSRLPTKFHWRFLEKLFPNWIEKTFTQLLMSSPEETMSNLFDVRESIEYSERFASRWFPIILVIVLFLLIGSCLSLFREISQVPVLPMTSSHSQVYYHQSFVSLCISKRVSPFGHSYSFLCPVHSWLRPPRVFA